MEQARQQDPAEVLALRHKLRAAGYSPIPLYGKTPPVYGKNKVGRLAEPAGCHPRADRNVVADMARRL
jgi:hypothetical protein